MGNADFFMSEECFFQVQRDRLCRSSAVAFAGPWVNYFWFFLRSKFTYLSPNPVKLEVVDLFEKTPQERIIHLFGALSAALKKSPPTLASETYWAKELATYAAMRWIDFSIWSQLPCWQDDSPGRELAKTVDLPAMPSLLAHVAVAGLLGRPWRITEQLGIDGVIDLSGMEFSTSVAEDILCALYDEVSARELDWPRRFALGRELSRKERAKLRHWAWERQNDGETGDGTQYLGVQISLTGLAKQQKQDILQGVAQAVNSLVLNVAPEGSESNQASDDLVSFEGVDLYDIAEHIQGILRKLRYFGHEDVNTGEAKNVHPTDRSQFKWDVFLSHASEDKPMIVDALVAELRECGLMVWYDRDEIKGDQSLGQGLEQGFLKSRFMVAVISRSYLDKKWTIAELEAAQSEDPDGRRGKLLVVRRKISHEDLQKEKPFIANRFVLDASEMSVEKLAKELHEAMKRMTY